MSLWLVPHPTVFVTHLWIHGMYVCIYLICVCVPMYACKHVCTLHECIYVCSHICTQTPMYLLLNVFMYVRMYAPRHLCIFPQAQAKNWKLKSKALQFTSFKAEIGITNTNVLNNHNLPVSLVSWTGCCPFMLYKYKRGPVDELLCWNVNVPTQINSTII